MAQLDKDNVLNLIINDKDPVLARYEYIIWFLSQYEGEFVDSSLQRIQESMMWYAMAFDVDQTQDYE